MAKKKRITKFVCQKCGYETTKWLGRCPNCGQWETLVETEVSSRKQKTKNKKQKTRRPRRLAEIKEAHLKRISTGIEEFDRVMGDGIVPGSVTLLAGEPGIGKSTLMLQVAEKIGRTLRPGRIFSRSLTVASDATNYEQRKNCPSPRSPMILYIAGEESAEQLKLRASRLGIKGQNLIVLEETNVEEITEQIRGLFSHSSSGVEASTESRSNGSRQARTIRESIGLIIVDSVQTLETEQLTGIPGSIGQVRACSQKLFNIAKKSRIPMFFIGHVTKEGTIAGPKTIEHLVDTVLHLEGERNSFLRILRSLKNRFGSTDEVGVFQMKEKGLEEVANPSQLFLGDQAKKPAGSAVTVTVQGTRPILAEVESLVVSTKLTFPKRVASGIPKHRLEIIAAVLTKLLKSPLGRFDIYTSVSGGLRVIEPGVDLAIALSILSSLKNKPLPKKSVVFGELGLLGEIRKVPFLKKRIKEAKKLGFKKIISPQSHNRLAALAKKLWP